jgi:hypothetical protein
LNRKLLILDVVLVAVLAYAGVQFRNMWLAAKAREAAELNKRFPAVPAPLFPPMATPPAVMATSYAEIPGKFLLDPSRNPNVPIEPPPPPPPPKPWPPLPVYHGQMNLGDGAGLFAILSVTNAAPHEAIHRGETIGQYKLLDVNREGIDLEWEGKKVHKTLYEVTDHGSPQQQADAAPQRAVAAPAPVQAHAEVPLGPGADTGRDNIKICQPYDSNPAGTIVDGYRKVFKPSPFGNYCYWEPVGGTAGR